MDKNKTRTDLLAAGRKTLQQFRQKKDGKGSNIAKASKKSKKSEEHGSDASTTASVSASAVIPLVPEGEITTHSDSDSVIAVTSVSQSTENTLPTDANRIEADLASETVQSDAVTHVTDFGNQAELGVEASVASGCNVNLSVPPDGESHESPGTEVTREMSPGTIDIRFSELETELGNEALVVNAMHHSDSVDATKTENLQASIISSSDQGVHRICLSQARDQKSDDPDSSGSNSIDTSDQRELHQEGELSVSRPSEIKTVPLEVADLVWRTPAPGTSVDGFHIKNQHVHDVVSGSFVEDTQENTLAGASISKEITEGYKQDLPEGSDISDAKSCNEPYVTGLSSSPRQAMVVDPGGGCTLGLLNLVEAIRGLSEDEYNIVLRSRESAFNESALAGSHTSPSTSSVSFVEKLTEELYMTKFTKDIFQLQLAELSVLKREFDSQHVQLLDEVSIRRTSFDKENERNIRLAKELDQCRTQLSVSSERGDLQQQCDAATARAEECSVQAHAYVARLEKCQEHVSALSEELADSKNLIATLRVENQNLAGDVAFLKEERDSFLAEHLSFSQEKERLVADVAEWEEKVVALQLEMDKLNATLTSVYGERNKLLEEIELSLEEKEKLLSELADCKSLVANLQMDNSNLSTGHTLVTEGMKKLEEDKGLLERENHTISSELDECRALMETLKAEIAKINMSTDAVTEKLRKSEEDREYLVSENERLNSELLAVQGKLSTEYYGFMQLEAELKGAKGQIEQLLQENILLKSNSNLNKTKISENDNREFHIAEGCIQVSGPGIRSKSPEFATVDEISKLNAGKDTVEVFSVNPKVLWHDDTVDERKVELLQQEGFDTSSGFEVLNERLEEVERMLENLEKTIGEIFCHAVSSNKSSSEMTASGVSKLIEAFESKVQHDEHEEEGKTPSSNWSSSDVFASSQELFGNLKAVVRQLHVDASNGHVLFRNQLEIRKSTDFKLGELNLQLESLDKNSESLAASNIELGVLYEAVKQHLCAVEVRSNELEVLYSDLKEKESHLRYANTELAGKVEKYETKIYEMQCQFHDLELSLREQLENCQREALEKQSMHQYDWNSRFTAVIETVRRLDDCILKYSSSSMSATRLDVLEPSNIIPSVEAAIKIIENLHEKFKSVSTAYEATSTKYEEVNRKYVALCSANESATEILNLTYRGLKNLVTDSCMFMDDAEMNLQLQELSDPLDFNTFKTFIHHLEALLSERLQLQSANMQLKSDLITRIEEIEEIRKSCFDQKVMQELIDEVEAVVNLEDSKADSDKTHSSYLKSLVSLLVQKFGECEKQLNYFREEVSPTLMKLEEKINHLEAFKLQQETEILVLKESLRQAEEARDVACLGLQEKLIDLEQSELRVSSLREKLSIAVAKGKGLVVQRDSLKQSLSEMTAELNKCSEQLQLKDARIHELESKLKAYSEAGERVEALESELSYIRNSATALRESFLLKDSVLQRIEEILEDLDLPEHFHSRDIIEKVDWLARSATGNSVPFTDWDQKSSVAGSFTDTGLGTVDAWKDDVQPGSNFSEDLRRKHEELQNKFYALAESNEMLEQSLMERNQLVQRWEELLDRINMPAHLRSLEPEDRIEWLGSALAGASDDNNLLERKISDLENYCHSVTADMDDSRKQLSEIQTELQAVSAQRDHLSKTLETLSYDHEKLLAKVVQLEHENDELHSKSSTLQEELVLNTENVTHLLQIEDEVRKMQDLIINAIEDPSIVELVAGSSTTAGLQALLNKLIEKNRSVSLAHGNTPEENQLELAAEACDVSRSRGTLDSDEPGVASLNMQLEEALHELTVVKEERDRYLEKELSLLTEIEALEKKNEEFQNQLHQEDQKSASVREKLNVAVRKGKSLVQQRDSLKQSIEAMNVELGHLKSEIGQRQSIVAQYEQKIRDLSSYPEKVEGLQSELQMLHNHLAETERLSQDREHSLSAVMKTLGFRIDTSNPGEKLDQIVKQCHEFHSVMTTSEQESKKARRAAELLVAELNEVQERNDGLQEELEKSSLELAEIMRERDRAEAARLDALTQLENLSSIHIREKRIQFSEFRSLMSLFYQLRRCLSDVHSTVSGVFSKDLEFLNNLGASMKSCMEGNEACDFIALHGAFDFLPSGNSQIQEVFNWSDTNMPGPNHFDENSVADFVVFTKHHLNELTSEVNVLKEESRVHWNLLKEKCSSLANLVEILTGENISLKQSFEAMKRKNLDIESDGNLKDMEIVSLNRNMALLYDACVNSVIEIQNRKNELLQNNNLGKDHGMKLHHVTIDDELPVSGIANYSSEEHVKSMTEKLISAVRDFVHMQIGTSEGSLKEMKTMITNLQNELQEKDIQKENICRELVGQIKEAEAAAASYLRDLRSSKALVHGLERKLELMQEERKSMEEKAFEMQNVQATSVELEGKVNSLTVLVAAKDQEIESLMQALDEEEIQMDGLKKKIEKQEKLLQQKNTELENLEASRAKVVKKLSVTVTKFDELHNFSESLLSEVEKLQDQLQDRDAEISFLRQEVTRCTNDVLAASQMSNKTDPKELFELLTWFDAMLSPILSCNMQLADKRSGQENEYKDYLQKKVNAIIHELESLQGMAQSKDELLQAERSKVEELMHREETLQKTLLEKESQLSIVQGVGDLEQTSHLNTEIIEVKPIVNKWSVTGTSAASQVRSWRKANNDEVAVAIEDMDPKASQLEDEDDDKAHGFKSLTTSRIIPKFTRPASDMIDGLWVSCDRTLMRQPALRLGIMIYWALLHALLAAFVV